MKIKILSAMSDEKLEAKVNAFIARKDIEIKELQFQCTIFYFSVMISYAEI